MNVVSIVMMCIMCSGCVVSQEKYDSVKSRNRVIINENVGLEFKNNHLRTENAKLMIQNIQLMNQVREEKEKLRNFRRI